MMPRDAAEQLGLDSAAIASSAYYSASQVFAATRSVDADEEHSARQERSAYVAAHGLRAMGHLALSDPDFATQLAERLLVVLFDGQNEAWPLALALAPNNPQVDNRLHAAREQSRGLPRTYASELAACIPFASEIAANRSPGFDPKWPLYGPNVYGVNVSLLQEAVRSRNPALILAVFRSIEDALTSARDEYRSSSRTPEGQHWAWGISAIQPTDPEVLIALRACREVIDTDETDDLVRGLPMVASLVDIVSTIEGPRMGA